MTTPNGLDSEPLWLAIEKKILDLGSQDLSGDNPESTIQRLAGALDDGGFSVSKNAGHMLDLRGAIGARATVGRPLMEDLNKAFAALTLEDVASPYTATVKLINEVGGDWPALKDSERRPHLLRIVEKTRVDLLVAKAKGLEANGGIRLLIGEGIAAEVTIERLGITQEELDRVMAAVEAERAERARVAELLQSREGKSEADKIRHLITSDVSDELVIEMAEVDKSAIDDVKKARFWVSQTWSRRSGPCANRAASPRSWWRSPCRKPTVSMNSRPRRRADGQVRRDLGRPGLRPPVLSDR